MRICVWGLVATTKAARLERAYSFFFEFFVFLLGAWWQRRLRRDWLCHARLLECLAHCCMPGASCVCVCVCVRACVRVALCTHVRVFVCMIDPHVCLFEWAHPVRIPTYFFWFCFRGGRYAVEWKSTNLYQQKHIFPTAYLPPL